jgi:hypothetical protein
LPQFVSVMRNSGTPRAPAACPDGARACKRADFRPVRRFLCWHVVGNVPVGMETVLLIGETGGRERSAAEAGGRPTPSLRSALERAGYAVVQAESGAKVLERLNGPLPDLILVTRPPGDMDTRELCARVRADATTQRIPIVLLADGSMRAAAGSADLIFPPTVSPIEVADRLRRLF